MSIFHAQYICVSWSQGVHHRPQCGAQSTEGLDPRMRTRPPIPTNCWPEGAINSPCAEVPGNNMQSNVQLACQACFQQFKRK